MRRSVSLALLVAFASIGLGADVLAAKKPLPLRRVTCGQTISESIRLANSLDCATGDGLEIDASNVTLDLNGHRIDGNDTISTRGIRAFDHARVKFMNGVVSNWEFGIGLSGRAMTVQGVDVVSCTFSGIAGTIEHSVVANNVLAGNGVSGLNLSFGLRNTIVNNEIVRNGDGITTGGVDNTFKGNLVSGNTDEGIEATAVTGSSFVRNRVTNNGDRGISLPGAESSVVEGNTVRGNNGDGIHLSFAATGNTVAENNASANGGVGIVLNDDVDGNTVSANRTANNASDGIPLVNASGNTVTKNRSTGNVFSGIALATGSDTNTLKSNQASANGFRGIRFESSNGNSATANTANENGEDGINSATATNALNGNRADRNGFLNEGETGNDIGLGVNASPGTPGSGNIAKDNDNPAQCVPASLCC